MSANIEKSIMELNYLLDDIHNNCQITDYRYDQGKDDVTRDIIRKIIEIGILLSKAHYEECEKKTLIDTKKVQFDIDIPF